MVAVSGALASREKGTDHRMAHAAGGVDLNLASSRCLILGSTDEDKNGSSSSRHCLFDIRLFIR